MDIQATDVSLIAFRNAGMTGYPYARGISWIGNSEPSSTDSIARKAIALGNAGIFIGAYVSTLIGIQDTSILAWGAYQHYWPSFPDTALALEAIRVSGQTYDDEGFTLGYIVGEQNEDGGWPYSSFDTSNPISRIVPTAYNVLVLNQYKGAWVLQTDIDEGIAWLRTQQKGDGSFGDGAAGSVYTTAVAYLAFAAEVGSSDPDAVEALDWLIAQQQGNGSWGNDSLQTGIALQVLPLVSLADTDGDDVPDDVELVLGTNPNQPDSRYLASGSDHAIPGETEAVVVANQNLSNFFSVTLADNGGTGPFTWIVIVGALPDGLSLNTSTGEISGVPEKLGTFNFTYTVSDSLGAESNVVSQITFTSPPADGDVNEDLSVDLADFVLATRIVLGQLVPTAAQRIRADVAPAGAPDGVVNAGDLTRIQRKVLGLISEL